MTTCIFSISTMNFLWVIATVVVVGEACSRQIPPGTSISQCSEHDCPEYVVDGIEEDYEVRTYPAGWWVGVRGKGNSGGLFMKLFRYISGRNDQSKKFLALVNVSAR